MHGHSSLALEAAKDSCICDLDQHLRLPQRTRVCIATHAHRDARRRCPPSALRGARSGTRMDIAGKNGAQADIHVVRMTRVHCFVCARENPGCDANAQARVRARVGTHRHGRRAVRAEASGPPFLVQLRLIFFLGINRRNGEPLGWTSDLRPRKEPWPLPISPLPGRSLLRPPPGLCRIIIRRSLVSSLPGRSPPCPPPGLCRIITSARFAAGVFASADVLKRALAAWVATAGRAR